MKKNTKVSKPEKIDSFSKYAKKRHADKNEQNRYHHRTPWINDRLA